MTSSFGQEISNALSNEKVLATVEVESNSVFVETMCHGQFVLATDTRHGRDGFRALRYTSATDGGWDWDNHYQFYERPEDFARDLVSGDFAQARLRF